MMTEEMVALLAWSGRHTVNLGLEAAAGTATRSGGLTRARVRRSSIREAPTG
jgi:hypothetical protein